MLLEGAFQLSTLCDSLILGLTVLPNSFQLGEGGLSPQGLTATSCSLAGLEWISADAFSVQGIVQ